MNNKGRRHWSSLTNVRSSSLENPNLTTGKRETWYENISLVTWVGNLSVTRALLSKSRPPYQAFYVCNRYVTTCRRHFAKQLCAGASLRHRRSAINATNPVCVSLELQLIKLSLWNRAQERDGIVFVFYSCSKKSSWIASYCSAVASVCDSF